LDTRIISDSSVRRAATKNKSLYMITDVEIKCRKDKVGFSFNKSCEF
jgi:hypothetical protein